MSKRLRICFWCDRQFLGEVDQLFCSADCKKKDMLEMGPGYIPGMVACRECGKYFKARDFGRFCSNRCREDSRKFGSITGNMEGTEWDARRQDYDGLGDYPSNVDGWK